ncbi:MAG: hypothetical protein K1X67_06235 [Fimbriimonadaceae bacterium]|nr:hypothetical protein [Fimbriimonadaceae bacterium]
MLFSVRALKRGAALAMVAAMGCLSQAAVVSFGAAYVSSYEQISDAEPAPSMFNYFFANIYGSDGSLEAANLTLPDSTVYDLGIASFTNAYMVYGSPIMGTMAEVEAAYPAGDYQYQITAGSAAPDSAVMSVPATDFTNEIPYLNGGSWSSLQYCNAGDDRPLTWSDTSNAGNAPILETVFYVFDYVQQGAVVHSGAAFSSLYTGDTVPGTVLLSGHTYAYQLEYYSYYNFPALGFGGADGISSYIRTTVGYFHVAANPGTVSGQLTLSDYAYPTGMPITVDIVDSDGTVLDTQTFPLGAYGYYAFDTAVTGVKSLRFRSTHWLVRQISDVDLGVGQDTVNPVLINGDIDQDNEVSIGDYAILSSLYGLASGDPGYDIQSDLDGDLEIGIGDYAILSANYNQAGD